MWFQGTLEIESWVKTEKRSATENAHLSHVMDTASWPPWQAKCIQNHSSGKVKRKIISQFPAGQQVKNPACNTEGTQGSILGSEDALEEEIQPLSFRPRISERGSSWLQSLDQRRWSRNEPQTLSLFLHWYRLPCKQHLQICQLLTQYWENSVISQHLVQ